MDTTRRYPRTLAEAFPDVRAPAIERPAPRIGPAGWLVVSILAVLACAGVAHIVASIWRAAP